MKLFLSRKLFGVFVIVVAVLTVVIVLLAAPNPYAQEQVYGVTFSAPHATGIGLDWKEAYIATLDELDVRYLRLSAYWDSVEPQDDQFVFSDLDFQLDEAQKRGAQVVLGVGWKLPRWPECHTPQWASQIPQNEQQVKALEMIEVVVERYKDHPALMMWQLENEPLLDFGICPPEDRDHLAVEEALLRRLDSGHPVLITDSGELNSWLGAAQYGDVVGTTMYRTVFSKRTQKLFHYDYLFPSWLYRFKSRYVKALYGKDVLISELQGEPWGSKPFPDMSQEERLASFSPDRFVELANFSRRTQLPQVYWWGVEYWYWEKVIHNNPIYWEMASELF